MSSPSVTYVFVNGNSADAGQVNQNFSDIINALSDSTKDLSISALTAAGTATFNGSVSIGNSASDDLTITASLASTMLVKTTNSFDIGSTSSGLRAIYVGANAKTFGLSASASATANWLMTAPPATPSADDYLLRCTTAGVSTWQHPGPITASGSDADTVLTITSNRHQKITPTANRSYTLPTTSVIAGDIFYFSNDAAVDANSFSIIVKASGGTTVRTVYPKTTGMVMALQDTPTTSAHWISLDTITSNWAPFTSTFTGLGTVGTTVMTWRRNGSNLEMLGYTTSGAPSGASAPDFTLPTLPSAITIDTTNFSTTNVTSFGEWHQLSAGGGSDIYASTISGTLVYGGAGTSKLRLHYQVAGGIYANSVANTFVTNGNIIEFSRISLPISAWSERRG